MQEPRSQECPLHLTRLGHDPLAVLGQVLANPFNFGYWKEAAWIYSSAKSRGRARQIPKGPLKVAAGRKPGMQGNQDTMKHLFSLKHETVAQLEKAMRSKQEFVWD